MPQNFIIELDLHPDRLFEGVIWSHDFAWSLQCWSGRCCTGTSQHENTEPQTFNINLAWCYTLLNRASYFQKDMINTWPPGKWSLSMSLSTHILFSTLCAHIFKDVLSIAFYFNSPLHLLLLIQNILISIKLIWKKVRKNCQNHKHKQISSCRRSTQYWHNPVIRKLSSNYRLCRLVDSGLEPWSDTHHTVLQIIEQQFSLCSSTKQ